jgi:hypothetical protein
MSVALSLLLSVAFALPASGVDEDRPWFRVDPVVVNAGDVVTFAGRVPASGELACSPDNLVVITSTSDLFPPDGRGPELARDGLGDFVTTYTVPDATPAGEYALGLRCGGANVAAEAHVEVVAEPVPGEDRSRTGWVVAAGALAVAGAVAFGIGLRRISARTVGTNDHGGPTLRGSH